MKSPEFDVYAVPAGPERRAILRARRRVVALTDYSLKERAAILALPNVK